MRVHLSVSVPGYLHPLCTPADHKIRRGNRQKVYKHHNNNINTKQRFSQTRPNDGPSTQKDDKLPTTVVVERSNNETSDTAQKDAKQVMTWGQILHYNQQSKKLIGRRRFEGPNCWRNVKNWTPCWISKGNRRTHGWILATRRKKSAERCAKFAQSNCEQEGK